MRICFYIIALVLTFTFCEANAESQVVINPVQKGNIDSGFDEGSAASPEQKESNSNNWIQKFLKGPNVSSICSFLNTDKFNVKVAGVPIKLADVCGAIVNCVLSTLGGPFTTAPKTGDPQDMGSRADCGLKECYSAFKNVFSGSGSVKDKFMETANGCATMCRSLMPANSKGQKICGVTDCFDDAVKLVSNPGYQFPPHCCSVTGGLWGGQTGAMIDMICRASTAAYASTCITNWGSSGDSKHLAAECCTSLGEIAPQLGGIGSQAVKVADAYCSNAGAIEQCRMQIKQDKENCAMLVNLCASDPTPDANCVRINANGCQPKPGTACCSLAEQMKNTPIIKELLDEMTVDGSPITSFSQAEFDEVCKGQ